MGLEGSDDSGLTQVMRDETERGVMEAKSGVGEDGKSWGGERGAQWTINRAAWQEAGRYGTSWAGGCDESLVCGAARGMAMDACLLGVGVRGRSKSATASYLSTTLIAPIQAHSSGI